MATLLITGGAGYVSSVLLKHVHCALSKGDGLGMSTPPGIIETLPIKKIVLVDCVVQEIPVNLQRNVVVESYQADLTSYKDVCSAFETVHADAVCHLASYGMSGREQLHKELIWKVNVEGTKNVVKACRRFNVRSLVFTSTVNVVFGGQRIEGGDETLPYFDMNKRKWDNYGNSKTVAEREVLQANSSLCSDGKTYLQTCVLRLPGIYGPNERRHIPRVVGLMKAGLFIVTYGDNPVVDFIHVSKVCDALLLSTQSLLQQTDSIAAGKAYFISDGAPINNFEFFRPLTEALNVPYPTTRLPMWLVYLVATLIEWFYGVVHTWIDFQPLLCRAEVYKTAQTHYFCIDKAQRELGYKPQYQNDMVTVANQYRNIGDSPIRNRRASGSSRRVSILLMAGLLILTIFIYFIHTLVS